MISFPQRNSASLAMRQFSFAARCVFVGVIALSVPSARANNANASNGDVVIQWNQILTDTLRVSGIHPPTIRVERSYCMLQIAMFDAINSIERQYTPFLRS